MDVDAMDLKLADLGLNPDEVKELEQSLNAANFDASDPTDRVCTGRSYV